MIKKSELILNRCFYILIGSIIPIMMVCLYKNFLLLGFFIFLIFVTFIISLIIDDINDYKNLMSPDSDRNYPFNTYN